MMGKKHKMTRSKKQREKQKQLKVRTAEGVEVKNLQVGHGKPRVGQSRPLTIDDLKERIAWLEYMRATLRKPRNKQEMQRRFMREDQLNVTIKNMRIKLELEEKKCQTNSKNNSKTQ